MRVNSPRRIASLSAKDEPKQLKTGLKRRINSPTAMWMLLVSRIKMTRRRSKMPAACGFVESLHELGIFNCREQSEWLIHLLIY